MSLFRVKAALGALRRGQFVVVADDQDRENEGDLILAAHRMLRRAVVSCRIIAPKSAPLPWGLAVQWRSR